MYLWIPRIVNDRNITTRSMGTIYEIVHLKWECNNTGYISHTDFHTTASLISKNHSLIKKKPLI